MDVAHPSAIVERPLVRATDPGTTAADSYASLYRLMLFGPVMSRVTGVLDRPDVAAVAILGYN